MPPPKKVRFFATIDGIEQVLVSALQNRDGGLTITSRTPTHFEEIPGKTSAEFKNQHYSVHETHGGNSTSITQKTAVHDADYSAITLLVNTKEYLLWPIFARRVPIFTTEKGILKRKASETAIEVAKYSYDRSSLLFGVWVARPTFDLKYLTSWKIDFKHAIFENHIVIVIPYFIHVGSIPSGEVLVTMSSAPRKNGLHLTPGFQLNPKSYPGKDLIEVNRRLMLQLRNSYFFRVKHDMREFGGLEMPEIDVSDLKITQEPFRER